jgi:diacylglycerol kinase family enzyme
METSLRGDAPGDASSPYRRLSLVLNEKAGAMLAAGKTPDLAARLEAGGAITRQVAQGHLPDRLRAALADADAVVVAGGDGTVACAAAVLAGTGMPLGILPGGTMNLLACDLHLPAADMDAAADVILAGRTRDIDVGYAGGHVFLCACMLGEPARLGRHREQARMAGRVRRVLRMARAALRIVARPRRLRLTLSVDGVAHAVKTSALTITLNALADGQGRLFARPALDGGTLVAYVVRRPSAFALVRSFVRMAIGRPRDPSLLVLQGSAMRIEAKTGALHMLVDGEERLMSTPFDLTIQKRALRVFAPAP